MTGDKKLKYLSFKINSWQKKVERGMNRRLICGIMSLAFIVFAVFRKEFALYFFSLGAVSLCLFIFFIYQQKMFSHFLKYLQFRKKVQERREQNTCGKINLSAQEEISFKNFVLLLNLAKSTIWEDLDLMNTQGLFSRIFQTYNLKAFEWLLKCVPLAQAYSQHTSAQIVSIVRDRQEKVKFLLKCKGLRKKILTLLSLNLEKNSTEILFHLLESPLMGNQGLKYLVVLFGYYLTLDIFMLLNLFHVVTNVYLYFLLGLLLITPFFMRQIFISKSYGWTSGFEAHLHRFNNLSQTLERLAKRAEKSKILLAKSFLPEKNFNLYHQELNRIIGALGVKQNFIVYLFLHLVGPWDFYWTYRAEKWRQKVTALLPQWLEDLAELEALVNLSEYVESFRVSCFPELMDDKVFIQAKNVYHPLMDQQKAVANDVLLSWGDQQLSLITGSNMSGKSTYLRTIGLNLVLTFMGGKVLATEFSCFPFVLLTSLKRTDSLEESLSTFYAEVKNLKQILDISKKQSSLYLIDEIFRGTNNRERLQGAQKYVEEIIKTKSVGFITTHDLDLCSLDKKFPIISNEHFSDDIIGGKMVFKYKKNSGPCFQTNALKVMELEGLWSNS